MLKIVTKADGSKQRFDKEKIARNCRVAGASNRIAEEIADIVEQTLEDGASTHQIHELVQQELEKYSEKAASIFGLREAIADLDSVSFEKYIVEVLEENGYECKWNTIVEGKCIGHQIDVIAKKDGKIYYIECKRHFNPHRFCGLEVPLEVQARLEDLHDGFKEGENKYDFTSAWIITNSKFSEHAIKYAKAKNVLLTGWGFGLQDLVEKKKIYPVTILNIDTDMKMRLLKNDIITVQNVLNAKSAPRNAIVLAKMILK